ncbi:glycosyltransferase family 9 protein [Fusobacterium sp. HC1336]|uniref:glycosyltransferase family 9 protein n=1 Tax=Fusobacterium sp. HC1336 TaxID=3171169 RepID=UPI003F1E857C
MKKYNCNYEKLEVYIYIMLVKIISILFIFRRPNKFPNKIKKILLVRPDHLGDTIISTVVLKPLRENYLNAEIDIICGSWSKKTYQYQKEVNNIYVIDHFWLNRNRINLFKKVILFFKQMLENRKELKEKKYDICIMLRGSLKANLLYYSFLLRPKYIIGFEGMGSEKLLDNLVKYSYEIPEKINLLNLLKKIPKFKLYNSNYKYELFIKKNKKEKKQFIKLMTINSYKNILFNFEGNDEFKKFSEKEVINLLKLFMKDNVNIYILHPLNKEKKVQNIEEELKNLNIENAIFLPLLEDFFDIKFILDYIDVLISVDTAVLHIGSIYVKNIIGLYSNDLRISKVYAPDSENSIIIQSKNKRIGDIPSEEIYIAAKKLLINR